MLLVLSVLAKQISGAHLTRIPGQRHTLVSPSPCGIILRSLGLLVVMQLLSVRRIG